MYDSAELGLYFAFLFTVMCNVWVVVCQPFVKRIYDDDDDEIKFDVDITCFAECKLCVMLTL